MSVIVKEKFQHAVCIGETGSGKTSGFIMPNLYERIKNNHGILFYDYKGIEHLKVKSIAKEFGKLEDVIEIGKPWGKKINIIQNLTINEINILFKSIHKNKNDFNTNASINLCINVINLLRAFRQMNLFFENKYKKSYDSNIFSFTYMNENTLNITKKSEESVYYFPIKKDISLNTLYKIINSTFNFKIFARASENMYVKLINLSIKNNINGEDFDYLMSKIKNYASTLKEYQNNEQTELIKNIILTSENVLSRIATNKMFNENEFNIFDNLNKSKIIIINSESIDNDVLSIINNSIFNELTNRVRMKNINKITIFIDEVQRVLNVYTKEIPIDIFRESKVELIMSFQNQNQIIEKISLNAWESILSNIITIMSFHTKNKLDSKTFKYDLSKLKTFEVFYDNKTFFVEPKFFNQQELEMVELEYQNIIDIKERYYVSLEENDILIHDQKYYEIYNSCIRYNIKKESSKIIEILERNKNKKEILNKEMKFEIKKKED